MTREGLRLASVGIVAIVLGYVAGWDGSLVFGFSILVLVILCQIFVLYPVVAQVIRCPQIVECERLSQSTIVVDVNVNRRLGIYAEVESDSAPRRLYRLTRRNRSSSLNLPLDTRRRFAGSIGPIHIVKRDPFGIARRIVTTTSKIDVLITPRVTRSPIYRSLPDSSDVSRESWQRVSSGSNTESLREYVVGDEPRRIHWRSSARLGQLMVRREASAPSDEILIVLDRRPTTWNTSPLFANDNSVENFELAVETVAALINELLPSGRVISLLCGVDGIMVVDITANRSYLRLLASVEMTDSPSSNSQHLGSLMIRHHGPTIYIVTRGSEIIRDMSRLSSTATIVEPDFLAVKQ